MNKFVLSYLETALWSSTDDNGEPLDARFTIQDIDGKSIGKAEKDCELFQLKAGNMIDGEDNAGHDFWLTRNRHGAGFWDGDYPEHGDALTAISHEFGECDLYVGDDGTLYL